MKSTGRNQRHKKGPSPLYLRRVVEDALGESGIEAGSILIVGVSGGPDSTALLAALASLREARSLSLVACIVDHGIRPRNEVEGDITFVRGLCGSLGIPLEIIRVAEGECERKARETRRSLEEVAREIRHSALADCARQAGACRVALGHTADDAAETILMRVLQGSDISGLAGIRRSRGMILRPLLQANRGDVLSYLEEAGIEFRTDPTNLDDRMLRNRIRRSLLPVLDRVVPGYRTGLAMLSRKLSLVEDLLLKESARLSWVRTAWGFSISPDAFFAAHPAIRAASMLDRYDQMRVPGCPRQLPYRFLQPVLVPDRPKTQGVLLNGHGVRMTLRNDALLWEVYIVRGEKFGYFIVVNGSGIFEIQGTGIIVEIRGDEHAPVILDRNTVEIMENEIAPPLILMSRRKGDAIRLKSGTKSLKQLFIEWKVPETERWKIPILADRNGVLAVLGCAAGHRTIARKGALASRSTQDARRVAVSAIEGPMEGRRE